MVPRVSVIIATYNWSSVLPYSIGSVLRQTLDDFEVLVVGDGCTDDSEDVVKKIGDTRVRWINLPANSGHQSAPNNEGLRQARGDIIAYLGHDDLWLPHHLQSMAGALDAENADVAYALMASVGPDSAYVLPTAPRAAYGSFSPPSCMVHRKRVTDAIGGWRDYRELNVEPEVELFRRAHAAGFRFTFVPRLTGIKFPASWRRDAYAKRASHEQAEWLARIDADANLEVRQLARFVVDSEDASRLPYREVVRVFVRETVKRLRKRLSMRAQWVGLLWRRKGAGIDDSRKFKGL